ncbi:hypothetical protein BpHYR1_026891 [Brachionus plicatilis]|uniref:Uncharacterized protein n=1 Tax=Brachionus plicatilis TaxID=10195 RepID=A0A3M7T8X6_BRAPC|nr:hypothetical protein BpHYR1_026891 [Brachionus plicatilis]
MNVSVTIKSKNLYEIYYINILSYNNPKDTIKTESIIKLDEKSINKCWLNRIRFKAIDQLLGLNGKFFNAGNYLTAKK